jgi:capsular exopolysaccharide synthesis family protein
VNILVALGLGLVAGMAIAVLRRALDTKIRGEQDVEGMTNSAILGVVPYDEDAPTHPVVMHDDPLGARSEAIRRLRTNLQFVEAASVVRAIVVTSSIAGEGKSTTSINLAVSLADAGHRVLLVDADLRRPAIAKYLGLEGEVGLTTVLIGKAVVEDVVQPFGASSLDILASGPVPPNPSELLGSKSMANLIELAKETYDTIVLDSSPLLPVTDAAVLSSITDGTLLVLGADRVHRPQLRNSLASLQTIGANILGIVLNKVSRQDSSNYGYYSGYYSSPGAKVPDEALHSSIALVPTAATNAGGSVHVPRRVSQGV